MLTKPELDRLLTQGPGREIDAAVVRYVYGGRLPGFSGTTYEATLCEYESTDVWECRDGTWSYFCRKCGEPAGYHDGYPAYSKSIESAFAAIETATNRDGMYWSILREYSPKYAVEIWQADDKRQTVKDWSGCAETLPLAICRALLMLAFERKDGCE